MSARPYSEKSLGEIEAMKRYQTRYRMKDPVRYMLKTAKSTAARRGYEFNLESNDIIIPNVCPVFKTPFEYGTDFSASLDRIDSTKGYVKGNVQVISRKANRMKNNATPQELSDFARWVLNV